MSVREFKTSGGYGVNTREPYVQIEFESFVVQVSPEDAREFAFALLRTAEAAYTDAFLVEFFVDGVGGDIREAAVLLQQFREWRNTTQKW